MSSPPSYDAQPLRFYRPIPFPEVAAPEPTRLMVLAQEQFFDTLFHRLERAMLDVHDGQRIAYSFESGGQSYRLTAKFVVLPYNCPPPPGTWYVGPPMTPELRAELTKRCNSR